MLARKNVRCQKESRRYYRNEFRHSGKPRHCLREHRSKCLAIDGRAPQIRQTVTEYLTVAYGRKLDVLRTLFSYSNAVAMSYRPPTVTLQIPAEKIDGQTVTFRPVRDGINSEVSGVIQVVERANGFSVNASYVVGQNPPEQSHVSWFDQSEMDAIASSLPTEKRRILI